VRYEADFFEKFSPRTALDMVKQVPSFSLQDVDEDKRGYAAAAGNVLIDGERPSTKSQTLEDILQRIPAAQVLRLEVLRREQHTLVPLHEIRNITKRRHLRPPIVNVRSPSVMDGSRHVSRRTRCSPGPE